MEVYKTGEIHSNGSDVYRRVGKKPKKGKYGMLGGEYFIDQGWKPIKLYIVGKPYKDEYGVFDGEPICALADDYIVVK